MSRIKKNIERKTSNKTTKTGRKGVSKKSAKSSIVVKSLVSFNPIDVVFHSNYGNDEVYSIGVKSNSFFYLPPIQFTRKDFVFVGWSTSPDGNAVYADREVIRTSSRLELYGQWEQAAEHTDQFENVPCIVGYDPLPVIFRDMSDIRSFGTAYWKYDFGDSTIYGTDTSSVVLEPSEDMLAFELPSDNEMFGFGMSSEEFKENIAYFHASVPYCLMRIDVPSINAACPSIQSCRPHTNKSYHKNGDIKHFTGMYFSACSSDTSGNGCYISPEIYDTSTFNSSQKRVRYIPNTNESVFVGVQSVYNAMSPDRCARVACELEEDLRNSISHVYKGPGYFLSTMTCSSEAGLQGMELADDIFNSCDGISKDECDRRKEKIEECWVKVLPVCPCVSGFSVYGTVDGTPRKFKTVTASNYSCDTSDFASCTGEVSQYNCIIEYERYDGSRGITSGFSGYAPYLNIGASGVVVPRSLPVTGAWIDWGDWFTDYMSYDHTSFGEVISGWPVWETEQPKTVSGEHDYTMPGIYSVGIAPIFDRERIRKYIPIDNEYEECVEKSLMESASGCCIFLVEIPPKFDESNPIEYNEEDAASARPSIVSGIKANIIAGSYPISRVDWDFGDGSEIVSICTESWKVKKVEGESASGKDVYDVIGNLTGGIDVNYDTETTTVQRNVSDLHNVTHGYMNGNKNYHPLESNLLEYGRFDARDYTLSHTYIRNSVDDHRYGYNITCSAYAENTNTCVIKSVHVLPNGACLPDFNNVEGYVEMVDVRSDMSAETNIVLQSEKENRLYVNRVIDTEKEYSPSPPDGKKY